MSETTLTNRMIAERAGWWAIDYEVHADGGAYFGASPAGFRLPIPDYLGSVDEALMLPGLSRQIFHLSTTPGSGWQAEIVPHVLEYASTPAEAVCKAWLSWRESQ